MTIFRKFFLYILLSNLFILLVILSFPVEKYTGDTINILSRNKLQVIIFIALCGISALAISSLLSKRINVSLKTLITKTKGVTAPEDDSPKPQSPSEIDFLNLEYSIREMQETKQQTISQLNSEKNQLVALVNAINEGVVVISKDSEIILSNNKFNKMFESADNPAGRPYWEVIRISDITSLIETAIKTRESSVKEISTIYPYEKFYFINIIAPASANDEVLAIFYDITEFKNLEKIKADLVANVSHELRTPLTAIKGYVETLEDGAYDSAEEQVKFLNIIKRHTQRLIDIVSDLLVLSEIEVKESGKQNREIQQFEPVSINNTLLTCLESLKSKTESKRLMLKKELHENLPEIRANNFLLEQAFINLLDNAIKYTPENGNVGIKTSVKNGSVVIEICDSGIGIPKESIPRIFERFYRVDKDRSRQEGGTGLGLSIVKHSINMHGGDIRVESEMSEGTKFIINLPVS